MDLPADLVWTRARVTRVLDGTRLSTDRRVRVVVAGGSVRVYHPDGNLSIETAPVSGSVNGRVMTLVAPSGEVWTIEKQGCNCGGG